MIFEIHLDNLRLTGDNLFGTTWFPLTKYSIKFRRQTIQKMEMWKLKNK